MQVLNALLLLIPLFSAIMVAINHQWLSLLIGGAIVVATPIIFSLLLPLEKFIASKISFQRATVMMPIYYVFLALISIFVSWLFINSGHRGDIWAFLFAWSCCYVPYNYMLQAEAANGGANNLVLNVTNNFALVGYFIFGLVLNFTGLHMIWATLMLIPVAGFMLNGLPARLRA